MQMSVGFVYYYLLFLVLANKFYVVVESAYVCVCVCLWNIEQKDSYHLSINLSLINNNNKKDRVNE